MKRHMLAIAIFLILSLCGCMNEVMYAPTASPTVDMPIEQSYDLYQLREFFVPHHMDDSLHTGELDDLSHEEWMEKLLTYDEVNSKYPVTFLKQVSPVCEYVVYPVDQGGFYYVFLCYYQTVELREQTPKTTDYLYVHFTAYLGNNDCSEGYSNLDYYKIIPGTTTMAEIRQADPYAEYIFLSRGTYTCSLLDNTTVLQIRYGYDKNNNDPNKPFFEAMIVNEVEVKKIENTVSIFAELLRE